jgi:N-dimethylarginine dimethylaminohydrolase
MWTLLPNLISPQRLSPWIYKPQNYIRRYIDKDFYSTIPSHHQKQGPELERIHLGESLPSPSFPHHADPKEHCVDQIRQSLQCGGDITPVTMALYGVGEKSVIIGTSQRHTCRDFEALREWQRRKNREVGIEPLDLA